MKEICPNVDQSTAGLVSTYPEASRSAGATRIHTPWKMLTNIPPSIPSLLYGEEKCVVTTESPRSTIEMEECEESTVPVTGDVRLSAGVLGRLRSSRTFTMALFAVVMVLLFSDQSLMAPNLSQIADEFDFSDEEKDIKLGGRISAAFFGFGAPASLLAGWLTDVLDRRKLFVVIVLIGELGALSTVFVTTYTQLFWTRAITGVAVGGGIPLVFSIMGDLFGSSKRTEAAGAIGIAIGAGNGLGQVVAGLTGNCMPLGWRFPFVLVAIPSILLAGVVLVATRDPPRGRQEEALQQHFKGGGEYTERPTLQVLRHLTRSPTFVMALVQGLAGCVPWGVFAIYLNDFLHQQRGMTVFESTMILTIFGIATGIGQLGGSKLGQCLYNRNVTLQAVLMGVSTLTGIIPCLLLIAYTGGSFWAYSVLSFTGGSLAAITGPNMRSVVINVTLPSTRGTAFGIFNLFDELGRGLGPSIISILVVDMGREKAFSVAIFAWILCGAIIWCMTCTIKADVEKVHTHLVNYPRARGILESGPSSEKSYLSLTGESPVNDEARNLRGAGTPHQELSPSESYSFLGAMEREETPVSKRKTQIERRPRS